MANIFTIINKEVEKGNNLIDKKGNFISMENLEKNAKKSYLADLKNGSIPFEKSYEDYRRDIIESGYIPVNVLITDFEHLLGGNFGETPEMPAPVENDAEPETVAN